MATRTTKSSTSTAAKPKAASTTASTRKTSAAAKTKAPATSATAVNEQATPSAETVDRVRRPDLINAVAERVSAKRSDVREVMDAVFDELGKALETKDEVVIPPLGKLMVKKRQDREEAKFLVLRLRRSESED